MGKGFSSWWWWLGLFLDVNGTLTEFFVGHVYVGSGRLFQ